MEQRNKRTEERNLLPFHILKAASEGDAQAIQAVLGHYEGYIAKLSTRKMYDEFGQVHYCVDETLRKRLETKLIAKTLAFRPVPYKDIQVIEANWLFLHLDNSILRILQDVWSS